MSNNTATIKTRKNLVSTRTITMTALLAAISYVLAFLEFPVPLSPSFGEFLPFIKTKLDVVLFNALPFNILKGLVIGAITMMIYKKLTPILKGEKKKKKKWIILNFWWMKFIQQQLQR